VRLLWRLTTPRRLRRNTLIVLLAWTAVAFAHQNGLLPELDPAPSVISSAR
jgi:hypothetical protein